MESLILLAAKSLIVAGGALLLLKLAQHRSACDRSWIAHLGLAAVLILPVAAVAFPALEVAAPAFLASAPAETTAAAPVASHIATAEAASSGATFSGSPAPLPASSTDWAVWLYAAPAALLLLLTLIALGRLIALKARATVLVEPNWLTALARAQRRMGFKHGTALLTSDDLPSPISWGLMRPVILLNSDAAKSHKEAEAIIAHELAHVANLDWMKLLLARVATAIFWFNPLVWMLAREAHQLREEAADDAVLGADIEDTEYARLLVGVARHECRGLLIGAHGVAPAKNSLARRVRRVLDGALSRAPGGWRWSAAAAFFAAGMAVPLAALNFVPTTAASATAANKSMDGADEPRGPYYASAAPQSARPPAEAGGAINTAVASAVATAVHPHPGADDDVDIDVDVDTEIDSAVEAELERSIERQIDRDLRGRSSQRTERRRDIVNDAIAAKIHGVTPAYAAEIRASSRSLANVRQSDLVAFRIHGVTPQLIKALEAAGYGGLSARQITNAAVHKVSPEYLRSIAASGNRPSFEDAVQMKILGIDPHYVAELRRAGYRNLTIKQIISMRVHGVDAEDLKAAATEP